MSVHRKRALLSGAEANTVRQERRVPTDLLEVDLSGELGPVGLHLDPGIHGLVRRDDAVAPLVGDEQHEGDGADGGGEERDVARLGTVGEVHDEHQRQQLQAHRVQPVVLRTAPRKRATRALSDERLGGGERRPVRGLGFAPPGVETARRGSG